MSKVMRTVFAVTVVAVTCVVLVGAMATVPAAPGQAAEGAEPAPPAGQQYVGAKECASCHFKQFMAWKKTKHASTFDLLPDKYQKDAKCLKCHTVGFGEPTGYKTSADAALKGTGCETCHGPGSKHSEICKAFGKEKLNEAQEKEARDSIFKLLPHNVCIDCHKTQGHLESETPKELRTKK
ncbi:MAG: cytochrome c family protein [Planctomycetota bacterium]